MGEARPRRRGRSHRRAVVIHAVSKLLAIAFAAAGLGGQCAQHGEHPAPPPAGASSQITPSTAPSGYAPITIDPSRVGPLGLATAKIEELAFNKKLRAVGLVTFDETKTSHVHAKVKGFIEALPADFIGKPVQRGAVLAAIYSQAILAAQFEHVALMKEPRALFEDSALGDVEGKSWSKIIEASRKRLLLWDMPRAQIDRLEKTLEPQRTFPIIAPRAGTLVAKQAVLGNYVEPGAELFTISDLSSLWVLVDIYEADVGQVAIGREAKLTIEGTPDQIIAKISFVSPTIDESTRTLKVRLELPNPGGLLKPGAFATAELDLPLGRGVGLPESSVIRTGTRNMVFVVHTMPDGTAHIVPREVAIGPLVSGYFRVSSGVAVGEVVATGAQFLIDSESRLKATTGAAPAGGHGGH